MPDFLVAMWSGEWLRKWDVRKRNELIQVDWRNVVVARSRSSRRRRRFSSKYICLVIYHTFDRSLRRESDSNERKRSLMWWMSELFFSSHFHFELIGSDITFPALIFFFVDFTSLNLLPGWFSSSTVINWTFGAIDSAEFAKFHTCARLHLTQRWERRNETSLLDFIKIVPCAPLPYLIPHATRI